MNFLDEIFKNITFLKYFKSETGRLWALVIVSVALIALNVIVEWYILLIMAISAIIMLYITLYFECKNSKNALDADVEKAKLSYQQEEARHRNDNKLL